MSGTVPAETVELVRDPAALEALAGPWRALAERTGADLWFRPEWFLAWWEGAARLDRRRRLAVAVLRRDGRLTGVLPFLVETYGLGPAAIRVVRLAGTDPNFAVLRLALEEPPGPALRRAVETVLAGTGAHAAALSPLSDRSDLPAAVREAFPAGGAGPRLAVDAAPRSHTVINLPDRYEDFLAGLSKSRRSSRRKSARALAEAHGLETRVFEGPAAAAQFDSVAALHRRQWTALGRPGFFGDWPGAEALHRAACARAPEARIYAQFAGGEMVAAQLCYLAGETCHAILAARAATPEFDRLGLGIHAQFERVERLIPAGGRLLESGAGAYGHKLSLGGELVGLRRMILVRPGAEGRLRLLLAWAAALDLAYYRAWVLKLSPRLARVFGPRRRPLWRAWVRTRL